MTKGGVDYPSFGRPRGLKALLYPYARSTHKHARQVLIDRDHLRDINLRHGVRHTDGDNNDAALKDYHQVLARAGKLTGRARDGTEAPEFGHPTLDEIMPHGSCDGAPHENGRLLWRSSTKTDLRLHTRTGLADHGRTADFFLYGLKHRDNIRRSLRGVGSLDLAVFDLTRTGQGRLAEDWPDDAAKVFKLLREHHPRAGVLVLVDEPWSFDKCRFEVFNEQKPVKNRPRRPEKSVVITTHGGAIFGTEDLPASRIGATKVEAYAFRGATLELAEKLRDIGTRLRHAEDKTGMQSIRELVGTLRRNASLPGSLSALSNHVTTEHGQALASDVMTGYRVTSHVAALANPTLPAFQIGGAELADCLTSVANIFQSQQKETPMALMLEHTLAAIKNSSARSLFMFQRQPLADFAIDEFTRKFPWLEKKMESRMIVFSGQGGLSDIAGLPALLRNQFKKMYLVAPARNGVLSYFARSWLPEQIVVLADADTMRFSSRDALRLSEQIDEPAIGSRLRRYGMATAKAVEAVGAHTVNLDGIDVVPDDVKFPKEPVVDLTGGKGADRERIDIVVSEGQRILAWPGSALVLLDQSHSIDEFREVAASSVTEGDRICVLSAGFIEKARLVLNIPAAAAGEIRDYHELVLKKFADVPGMSESDRLRTLVGRIGDPEVDVNRARYWVTIRQQLDARIDEVVPHAPQTLELFLKFTGALGIGERMARDFWQWGVLAQRTTKLKAGMAFHEAYRGILVDPFAAMADNQKRIQEIRRLRLLAEDYVATVESVERIKP
ncbi:hypothetical protein [Rhizobium leguminosarum]|uniref:hypothetical protein n=1 Tax=Rhizobium leguminosarum TaxID=384 RepID=UPI0012F81859|nr:hypothetical protein [Rhizobium leguminosarum]